MPDRDTKIHAMPLPPYLVPRYRGWRATTYAENKIWYRKLADEGQNPRIMAIACCDSRVNVNGVFSAETGDIFLHRNIANVVPPYLPDGDPHGTSAALEYAVKVLRVAHVIVIGHTECGGVQGCQHMCSGKAPELETKESFVGRWLDILRPGYERVAGISDETEQLRALERETVVVSLENLWEFPFVREAVEAERLSLHGLIFDIGAGTLQHYLPEEGRFVTV
ncbi:carbonic anhydrase [Tropicimonas isoalkanivorans]|uniref:Carbonic anhydrase n=1 Tax=Tropicimonas isoalkanivorans TaxID=441112 RepID=A0A1I1P4Y3_9RHOB|nr:carbonic anhydrase [Tropicimonas isoalkanivorans]SFD01020.1 carbonic anhydrase [Tropicimonas isoalkanivorans]